MVVWHFQSHTKLASLLSKSDNFYNKLSKTGLGKQSILENFNELSQ